MIYTQFYGDVSFFSVIAGDLAFLSRATNKHSIKGFVSLF